MRITRCVVLAAAVAVAFGVATEKASAAFSVHIASNTLTATGDAASDTLALRLAPGAPNTLVLDVGNNGSADFTANRLLFNKIVVNAGAGNDTVLIDESKGAFTDQEATTLNGQDGNDTLTGGRGPETFNGADGNDRVTGGRGNDTALLGDRRRHVRMEHGRRQRRRRGPGRDGHARRARIERQRQHRTVREYQPIADHPRLRHHRRGRGRGRARERAHRRGH